MSNSSTQNCTSVTPDCPVDLTVYGYYPSLPANAFFCAYFALFTIVNLLLTLRFKTWSFGILMSLGCAGEMAGYIGRLLMHSNPWSNVGFETQICTLIFSPSFLAAGLYLTLAYMVQSIGPQFSAIKAALYPWIFICCDVFSLVLQAIGGGVASSANTSSGTALGGHIMLAGIIFQVATFTFLYILVGFYILKLVRNRNTLSYEATEALSSREFKIFSLGILAASILIFVRCVYRIAELAGGWANPIMRDETGYIVLDGVMCCSAVLVLVISHPGFWFKPMLKSPAQVKDKGAQISLETMS